MPAARAQSAMEYLMTYGWAILIIAVVLGALYQLGVFGSGLSGVSNSCLPISGFICSTPVLNTSGSLAVLFGQVGSTTLTLSAVACTVNSSAPISTTTVNGIASSDIPFVLEFPCPITSSALGTIFRGYLWIVFGNGIQNNIVERIGTVTAKVSTTGSSAAVIGGSGTTTTTSTTTSTTTTSTSTTSTSTSTTTTSTTTTIILPPVLEAHASGFTFGSSQATGSFTTSNTNDMIIAIAQFDGGSVAPVVSDTNSLTWTLQYGGSSGISGECSSVWVYSATPGKALSGDSFTASRTSAALTGVFVLAVSNANAWDPNGSLPSTQTTSASNVITTTYSTSNPNDMIIGIGNDCHGGGGGPFWTGLTDLDAPGPEYYKDAYKIVSSTQSSASATLTVPFNDVAITVIAVSST